MREAGEGVVREVVTGRERLVAVMREAGEGVMREVVVAAGRRYTYPGRARPLAYR